MGGHAIPNTSPIKKEDYDNILTELNKYLPNGLNLFPFGSAGKKDVSNDIDIFVDTTELLKKFNCTTIVQARKALQQHFIFKNLLSTRSGITVHVGIPFKSSIVQIDIMTVENPFFIQQLHDHVYDNDTVSGKTIISMWCDMARMTEPSLMFSPYKGLFIRDTNEFLTTDKTTIAKFIIGHHATGEDLRSPSRIINALKDAEKLNHLKTTYNL